jgi:hypothetical protein
MLLRLFLPIKNNSTHGTPPRDSPAHGEPTTETWRSAPPPKAESCPLIAESLLPS